MADPNQILAFDRALMRRHRDRAVPRFADHRVLFDETAALLMERLGDVKRDFRSVLDLGAHDGLLAQKIVERHHGLVVAADLSLPMLLNAPSSAVVADEEFLPFAPNSFDLVVSNLSLHWVNDLPGALAQIISALKPEGLFLAALFGGHTLQELRACLLEAELSVTGGVSPRVSPSIDLPTASALLQRAGFALPVTDQETFTLTYPDSFALMRDLRGMGEANANRERSDRFTRRAVLTEADRLYRERYAGTDGRIPASFEILFLHGWRS